MKRLLLIVMMVWTYGAMAQPISRVDWFRKLGEDTVRTLAQYGIKTKFIKFADGSIMTTAAVGNMDSTIMASREWVRTHAAMDSAIMASRDWSLSTFAQLTDVGVLPEQLHDSLQTVRGEIFPIVQDSLNVKLNRLEAATLLSLKANTSHTQAISTITLLSDSLLNKYTRGEVNALLALKANTSHTQAISTITWLSDSLAALMKRSELGGMALLDTNQFLGSWSINQVSPLLKMGSDSAATRVRALSRKLVRWIRS